jgi:DNA-binding NarL/FixJ family response regulator
MICFIMHLLNDLLKRLGLHREQASHRYELDEEFHNMVMELAQQEQRSEQDVHADLLAAAFAQRSTSQDLWGRWQSLSRREQEVAALTCLGYTNDEIASRLGISHTTIKTHIRNILTKFQLHGKAELRMVLQEWDFRDWDRSPYK